jgi:ATP-dependent Clp protease protease subunit
MGGVQGQASDIDIHAREILKTREKLNTLLAEMTGKTPKQIAKDTDRDNFLSADEAEEYGLIDKVIHQRSDAGQEEEK